MEACLIVMLSLSTQLSKVFTVLAQGGILPLCETPEGLCGAASRKWDDHWGELSNKNDDGFVCRKVCHLPNRLTLAAF